jgi:hypothetical protein
MRRADTGFELQIPTDEELQGISIAETETLFRLGGLEALRAVIGGYPDLPSRPGLYALISPDDLMVKVIDQTTTMSELKAMIKRDIVERILRSFFTQGIADRKPFVQLAIESFTMYLRLKQQYRLELLPSPGEPSSEGR